MVKSALPSLCGEGVVVLGDPDFLERRPLESVWHHPDDRALLAVDSEDLAQHTGISIVAILPHVVAEKDGRRPSGRVLTRPKGPTDDRLDLEHVEGVRRDERSAVSAWSLGPADVDGPGAEGGE